MSDAALVFPVGHYLGLLYTEDGLLPAHRVRVGSDMLSLVSDLEAALWGRAHSFPNRQAVATRPEQHEAIETLLAAGLLVEVDPSSVAAEQFARQYRLGALMTGLGCVPDDPTRFEIGPARNPAVVVDEPLFLIWELAPIYPSLWDTCLAVAEHLRATPGDTLTGTLTGLHRLLAVDAAYLDLAG